MPGPISSPKPSLVSGASEGVRRAARIVAAAVPLTLRGFLFSLLAAGLTVLGAARAELGALLCGSGLGAAILLSLAGTLVEGRRQRAAFAADPEALEIGIRQPQRDDQGVLRGSVFFRNRSVPAPRAPGILAEAAVRLKAANGRVQGVSVLLPPAPAREESEFPERGLLLRGVYRGNAEIRARDVFGFCAVRMRIANGLEAVAWPRPSESWELPKRGAGGERPAAFEALVRGDDRFEARPYTPGDDPRRINWKQYARFGDLFVRPGDRVPPPRQTLRILLDTERPSYMAGEAAQAYLDALASGVLGFVLRMREQGRRVVGSSPGLPGLPEDEAGLRAWLADAVWRGAGGEWKNPGPEPLVVFGAPGGLRRKALFAERKARGLRTVLAVAALPPPRRSSWADRLLMEPPPESRGEPGRGFRAAYRAALERDSRELGGADVRVL